MTEEKKMQLFETMLRFETLAGKTTYDGVNYFDKSNGAFEMLEILGLSKEYIHWSEGKEYSEVLKKVVTY